MLRFLIDADIALYAMEGDYPALRGRIESFSPGEIGLSAISFAEIMLGAALGKPPPSDVLELFLAQVPILPFDETAARAYATLPFRRARFDRLLAAHAVSLGVAVATNNERDYADIPALRVENWTQ